MALMPVNDSVFLLAESREHPMHWGLLQLYHPPSGAGPDFPRDLYRRLLSRDDVRELFRRKPRGPVSSVGHWAWSNDSDLDLEYHVRLSALPHPGRVRELLELVGRFHGALLDRHRPLWEFHLIEGMADGRFATYIKVHHALMDGVSALQLLDSSLSADPSAVDMPPMWASRNGTRPQPAPERRSALAAVAAPARSAVRAAGTLVGSAPGLAKLATELLRDSSKLPSFSAPRSMLNVPITGARRYAAQSWRLDRLKAVGARGGATLNDVTLAMCSGALRRYLSELDALPEASLVAGVPMSIRTEGAGEGNAVGLLSVTLASDEPDPATRLARIVQATRRGKQAYRSMSPAQVIAVSALGFVPIGLTAMLGVTTMVPPPFNVLISNVPGPRTPLYWDGARLDGVYPVSIPYDGQALNITVCSYAGGLAFGLTGCRRSVPHLQRLLTHLDAALIELEGTQHQQ
jgi:diacylglycerol O-acyltransferase